jgi:predicted XRE-type DNA-binding protein
MRRKVPKQNQEVAEVSEDPNKAKIAKAIQAAIVERGLNQTQAGSLLDITQGDVSRIKNAKHLERFTFDRLLEIAHKIGLDAKLTLAPSRSAIGKMSVTCE